MSILGLDPGLRGAVAILEYDGSLKLVQDLPTMPYPYKGKSRDVLNLPELATLFDFVATMYGVDAFVVEKVGPMPRQGVTSSFRFGETVGAVHALAAANDIPMTLVTPQAWKKHFKLSSAKDLARSKATALWPSQSQYFSRVKDAGKAEAALMAEWYRNTKG